MICPGYARPPEHTAHARREACCDCGRRLQRKDDLDTCDSCRDIAAAACERMHDERVAAR